MRSRVCGKNARHTTGFPLAACFAVAAEKYQQRKRQAENQGMDGLYM